MDSFISTNCMNIVVNSTGNLVWHEGLIPKNEIWIKIGGDKGGGSLKMVFAIGNLENPNSTRNTIIFSMFEAGNTPYNLTLGLQGYDSVIENLNEHHWRYDSNSYFNL